MRRSPDGIVMNGYAFNLIGENGALAAATEIVIENSGPIASGPGLQPYVRSFDGGPVLHPSVVVVSGYVENSQRANTKMVMNRGRSLLRALRDIRMRNERGHIVNRSTRAGAVGISAAETDG